MLLVDTGADISLLKGSKLVGTTEYDPDQKIRVKRVDGSPMKTHGVVEANIELGNSSVRHGFQLVNKQVDIPGDGILGCDFLQRVKAKICYETRTVKLNGEVYKMVDKTKHLEERETKVKKLELIKLPPRTESIVRLPVTPGSPLVGVINKCEIQEGVIVAASLTKVTDGYVMTSILNTNDKEVEMQEPLVELEKIDPTWSGNRITEFRSQDRENNILEQLRLEHLNTEEETLLVETCLDFQDILFDGRQTEQYGCSATFNQH